MTALSVAGKQDTDLVVANDDQDAHQLRLKSIPKNVARWHMGAGLYRKHGNEDLIAINIENHEDYKESSLLGDDESVPYLLPNGNSSIIIDAGDYYSFNNFFFINYTARGQITIKSSNKLHKIDSKRWINLGSSKLEEKTPVNINFPLIEARYVLIDFVVEQGGEISSIGLYGATSIADTEFNRDKDVKDDRSQRDALKDSNLSDATVSYDFASLYSGTRISHISSTSVESANNILDDDPLTFHEFPQTEKSSVMVMDMKDQTLFNRLSFVIESGNGTMEIYYFSELPQTFAASNIITKTEIVEVAMNTNQSFMPMRGLFPKKGSTEQKEVKFDVIELPENFFDIHEPIFSKKITPKDRSIRFEFESLHARYLVLRWLPEIELGVAPELQAGLRIYEVSVLGDLPAPEAIVSKRIPTLAASNNSAFSNLSSASGNSSGGTGSSPAVDNPPPSNPPALSP